MKYLTDPRYAYIAGRLDRKDELVVAERVLQEHNILPGTPWLHNDTDIRREGADIPKLALMDYDAVMNADLLVFFSDNLDAPSEQDEYTVPMRWATGGRHVEFGIALASRLDIVIIGDKQNIFHHYRNVDANGKEADYQQIQQFDTLDDFVVWYDMNNEIPEDAE